MMVRGLFRVVAAWMLVALIAASVEPVVTYAMGGPHDESADHTCCPESVSERAPEGRATGTLPACCAVGRSSPRAPANMPSPVRSVAAGPAVVPGPSWHQASGSRVSAAPRPPAIFGPIPLVIRTSVLLI